MKEKLFVRIANTSLMTSRYVNCAISHYITSKMMKMMIKRCKEQIAYSPSKMTAEVVLFLSRPPF